MKSINAVNHASLDAKMFETEFERIKRQNQDSLKAAAEAANFQHVGTLKAAAEAANFQHVGTLKAAAEAAAYQTTSALTTQHAGALITQHVGALETLAEMHRRINPEMFETLAETTKRLNPEMFETAAEAARRQHPELFASFLGGTARSILEKQISSYARVNAFLAPTGVEALKNYEAKQKEEFTNLFGSLSGALAQEESKKMLASPVWRPFDEWPEVKPRFLGMNLHLAIESDDSRTIETIMSDPAFGAEVLKAMHQAAKMSVIEREATQKELTEACDNQSALRAIVLHVGVQAMAKENTIFSDERKEEIRTAFSEKKSSNKSLSDDAIYGLLVNIYGSSKSTIRRIVSKK